MQKNQEIEKLLSLIRNFRDKRNWMQFHSPKNMATSISIEASELLEHFQWLSNEESVIFSNKNREIIAEELADIAIYLFEMIDNLGLDVLDIMYNKIQINELKYPVEKAKNNAKKYTEYNQ